MIQSIGIGGFFGSAVGALFGYVKTRNSNKVASEYSTDGKVEGENTGSSTVPTDVFNESELFLILKKTQIICSPEGQGLVNEIISLVKKIRAVTSLIERRISGDQTTIHVSTSDLNLSCDRLSTTRQFVEKLGLCEKNAGIDGAIHRSVDEFNTYCDVLTNELDTFQSILNTHMSVFPA